MKPTKCGRRTEPQSSRRPAPPFLQFQCSRCAPFPVPRTPWPRCPQSVCGHHVSVCPAETGCALWPVICAHSSLCLCARVPCSVRSCDPGCPCGRGLSQPRCLPPQGAAVPRPDHSCASASAWPHCIPGAAWPPASRWLALVALAGLLLRPGQGGTSHSQDRPLLPRHKPGLPQPPVPAVAHVWVGSGAHASQRTLPGGQTGWWASKLWHSAQPPGCLAQCLACDQEARSCRRARGHVLGVIWRAAGGRGLRRGSRPLLQPGARAHLTPSWFPRGLLTELLWGDHLLGP